MSNPHSVKPVIVMVPKSMGISIILSVLFGPLVMLYSTIVGAIIMMIVSGIALVITVGVGLLITWPICIVWGAVATSTYNKKLMVSA